MRITSPVLLTTTSRRLASVACVNRGLLWSAASLSRQSPAFLPPIFSGSSVSSPVSLKRFYTPLSIDKPAAIYSFEDMKKLSSAPHDGVVLVDVREPAEYKDGHIPSAINIPYNSSPGALGLDPEDFVEAFGFDKPSTENLLVFYCLGGVRSTAAEGIAATYGYQDRANYVGSYQDWLANKGETEVPK